MNHKFCLLLVSLLFIGSGAIASESRMLVRIYLEDPEHIIALDDMYLDFASLAITNHADVVVTAQELTEIQKRGFQTEIIKYEEDVLIPPEYHTVDETWTVLDSLHQLYPTITELDTCGYSQRFLLPIPHFMISQNMGTREDEPAALITGMHHAREPIGNEICLFTIGKILEDYPDSAYAQRLVDSMDLHFVPLVNPEGWQYITDSSLIYPWWRKNLRDNGNNGGPINPDSDGVDLNRNYDWRWAVGGSSDPASWVYRGPSPASEREIQALVDLSTQRRFVVGISYHSYGYIVLFPWEYQGQFTPDMETLNEIAQNIGIEIGDYGAGLLGGSNMSSVWFYGQLGMYDFLIETAQSFIPPAESIAIETEKNFRGAVYLLNRSFYSGITGHVRDTLTLQPLQATVEVIGLTGDSIVPRNSDSLFGRFYRLLQNGTYTMRFSKPGYTAKIVSNISVVSDSLTKIEVLLAEATGVENEGIVERLKSSFGVLPNPFSKLTSISFSNVQRVKSIEMRIYDATGRLVRQWDYPTMRLSDHVSWNGTDDSGKKLSSGVYFIKFKAGDHTAIEKLLLIK